MHEQCFGQDFYNPKQRGTFWTFPFFLFPGWLLPPRETKKKEMGHVTYQMKALEKLSPILIMLIKCLFDPLFVRQQLKITWKFVFLIIVQPTNGSFCFYCWQLNIFSTWEELGIDTCLLVRLISITYPNPKISPA